MHLIWCVQTLNSFMHVYYIIHAIKHIVTRSREAFMGHSQVTWKETFPWGSIWLNSFIRLFSFLSCYCYPISSNKIKPIIRKRERKILWQSDFAINEGYNAIPPVCMKCPCRFPSWFFSPVSTKVSLSFVLPWLHYPGTANIGMAENSKTVSELSVLLS